MINQLWASADNRAKNFVAGENQSLNFGWKVLQEMWEREKTRRDNHLIRMVDGLVKSFIDRDAWTKLNVKPAKIMQVNVIPTCTPITSISIVCLDKHFLFITYFPFMASYTVGPVKSYNCFFPIEYPLFVKCMTSI